MLQVVIGITYGALLGLLGHRLVFRKMEENKRNGMEPLKGVGGIFALRYLVDAGALLAFAYVTKHPLGTVAAAISITVAVKVSLLIVYTRKGGRI